jgi:CheY-like chemotaxis protein
LASCSVLVVDDEESIRELVRDGLEARKMRVDVAASGDEALALLEHNSYRAVLCDLNLRTLAGGILSGREIYSRVMNAVSIVPGIPKPFFLFMTGELVETEGVEDLAATGARILQKPFRISELLSILNEALDGTTSRVQ